ncbi:MAG: 2-phosphosulfolactate phosphatase [Ignavibacteriales bacterium]|nr:putative 2-phosphosulfolactate phosphatase [Ignavibacteriaceae bacterium]QOJ30364.1 MAG: 2-phosphosulfolactate phosphatase [Ignavibacteriales bacterium]
MTRINVLFSPVGVDELYFSSKTAAVIDVLRASSTIVTAVMNGAKEIIPVGSIEFAVKVSGGMFGGQTLLCGEKNTKKVDGFNLGNSPSEFTSEVIGGKTVVLYTTNGTKAIVRAKFSTNLIIASFLNISASAKRLVETGESLEIICSGRNNEFSLEDTVCAGKLVSEILKINGDYNLTDSAAAALSLFEMKQKDIPGMMRNTEHGQILVENGFEGDIDYCSQIDITDVVPSFKNNSIKEVH